jgi:heterotetrameric sarcosine oxidase delta subunit
MLLIELPATADRAGIEFRNGGEAHIARPADPSALDDAAWGPCLFYRSNAKGRLRGTLEHVHGCQRWFNALRDTASDNFLQRTRRAHRGRRRARCHSPFVVPDAVASSIARSPSASPSTVCAVEAFRGDTVASALLANGIRLVPAARSNITGRAGIFSHGSDEPNALVAVSRGQGRVRSQQPVTVIEATEGLNVTSQNRWPSLRHDLGGLNDRLSPLFAAGFYYKTFMWPPVLWRALYEPAIRALRRTG